MRKSSGKASLQNYFEWLSTYSQILNRIYDLPNTAIPRQEKLEIFEAFVAKIWTQWDILAEDLLIDCLNKDSTRYADYMGMRLPKHIARNQCELMLRGLGYFDMKSISELQKIANNILIPEFNPFPSISKQQRKKLEEFSQLRNYLCHYSWKAERSLFAMYKSSYGLQRFAQPGNFLIASTGKPRRSRLQNYVGVFIEIGDALSNALRIEIVRP